MRTPRHVATLSTGVLVITVIVASVVTQLLGPLRKGFNLSTFAETTLSAVLLGALVWVGTYIGARYSAPHQRSDRLVRALSLGFMVLGVLISIPIQTHAVRIDMPSTGHTSTDVAWHGLLMPLGMLALFGVIPFVVTRVLAVAFGRDGR